MVKLYFIKVNTSQQYEKQFSKGLQCIFHYEIPSWEEVQKTLESRLFYSKVKQFLPYSMSCFKYQVNNMFFTAAGGLLFTRGDYLPFHHCYLLQIRDMTEKTQYK